MLKFTLIYNFEVLIFKHKKLLSVTRKSIENKDFVKVFMRTYLK